MPTLRERAEQLAVRYLSPDLSKKLMALKAKLPVRLHQTAPVVQMYLNDAHTRSFVGLNNFFSFLRADVPTPARVQLTFHDPSGRVVLQHALSLAHFAAQAVDVAAVFAAKKVSSPYGVVTVQMTPETPRRPVYRELGRVSAQFFVFFRDREHGSVEQTHPLSTADPDNRPSPPFLSSQVISTAKLVEVNVFQYNPSTSTHSLEHALVDIATNAKVATQRHSIHSLGAARSVFRLADISPLPAHLTLAVDALPSANSKPMLRRVFAGGQHSMSHA